jgi:hypothetical protein
MRPIRQPNPDRVDILTGGNRSGMPDDGTKSRLPRAFTLRTAKPVSALWNVTRSTLPTNVSRCGPAFLSEAAGMAIFHHHPVIAPLLGKGAGAAAERSQYLVFI